MTQQSKQQKIQSIIEFLSLVEKLKDTTRHNWTSSGRHESVAEHTWRVCLLFVLMYETFDLKVDPYRLLKMLLIHDIHELVDGDLPGFIKETISNEYQQKELEAISSVYKILPDEIANDLETLAKELETGEDDEVVLAKTCDRIETQLQHLNSGTAYWSEKEIGDHMLTYPDKYLNKLNNEHFNLLWDKIRSKLTEMTEELGNSKDK